MHDVIVVGAGLFGSVIAASLRGQGMDVVVIDDARVGAGSKPAACLMKSGWFAGLGKEIYEPALRELDILYGVKDLNFRIGPGHATVHWVAPSSILIGADHDARVDSLTPINGGWEVMTSWILDRHPLYARRVVLATGVWANELSPIAVDVKGQAGMAFLYPEERIDEPFISPWAPYRQLVAFNRGDGLWVGDGTSIKHENWSSEHAKVCEERARKYVPVTSKPTRLFGIRPYAKEKPCILREQMPGLWVASGGAKNGTLAAGWCGHRLGVELS